MIDIEELEEKFSIEGELGSAELEEDLVFITINLTRSKMKIHVFFLLLWGITHFAFAADFYASPSGNDSNPGTKRAPFATLGKAQLMVLEKMKTNPNENY